MKSKLISQIIYDNFKIYILIQLFKENPYPSMKEIAYYAKFICNAFDHPLTHFAYRLTSPNQKIYAGQTVNINNRFNKYNKNNGSNPHWSRALKKYKFKNFKVEYEKVPAICINIIERFIIYHFKLQDPEVGYNKDSGGTIGNTKSEEIKYKISQKALFRWKDPKFRTKMRKIMQSNEYRNKISRHSIANWLNPKYRANQIKNTINCWKDPKYRANQIKNMINRWKDPNQRKNHSKIMINLWKDPEYRQKQNIARDPKYRANMSKKIIALWQTPQWRAKVIAGINTKEAREKKSKSISAWQLISWKDPEWRAKRLASFRTEQAKINRSMAAIARYKDPAKYEKFLETMQSDKFKQTMSDVTAGIKNPISTPCVVNGKIYGSCSNADREAFEKIYNSRVSRFIKRNPQSTEMFKISKAFYYYCNDNKFEIVTRKMYDDFLNM